MADPNFVAIEVQCNYADFHCIPDVFRTRPDTLEFGDVS